MHTGLALNNVHHGIILKWHYIILALFSKRLKEKNDTCTYLLVCWIPPLAKAIISHTQLFDKLFYSVVNSIFG